MVDEEADIIVYGGTSGGVVAAVQAAREGKSVILVVFGRHVGGMTSGGLTWTDGVNSKVQGGITQEFFSIAGRTSFRPSTAEQVFEDFLADPLPAFSFDEPIPTFYEQRLESVEMHEGRITALHMENGSVFRGQMFLDCTYEGDLMAMAGVSYTYGRESSAQYGESLAGKRPTSVSGEVDAYIEAGNPESGLLYNLIDEPIGTLGEADDYVQAYNFRMFTIQDSDPANRQPLFQPEAYDASQFELIYRYHRNGGDTSMEIGNDINNNELFGDGISTDHIGGNRWPNGSGGYIPWCDADYATRELIYQSHVAWQLGMLWYLKTDQRYRALVNDPSLIAARRANIQSLLDQVDELGFPLGEYPETHGWPHELYVREGRRMVSDLVLTQDHCESLTIVDDPIGLANYMIDSHSCRRIVKDSDSLVRYEGGMSSRFSIPWRISYRAIVPRKGECENLLVPWSLSASHVAFCSLRMEPCFMVLAQSAATAASLAINQGVAVQDVDYEELKLHLVAGGQILGLDLHTNEGIVVDDADDTGVTQTGAWASSSSNSGYWATGYLHDGNSGGGKSVVFSPELPESGEYEVLVRWVSHANRASNIPIDVVHADGTSTSQHDQQKNGEQWVSLGVYSFDAGSQGNVTIRNDGANGYVIADAVRFLNSNIPPLTVHVIAGDPNANESDGSVAAFHLIRDTDLLNTPMTVNLAISGDAVAGLHYQPLPDQVTIPAGKSSTTLYVTPMPDSEAQGPRVVTATLLPNGTTYTIGPRSSADVILQDKPYDAWRYRNFFTTGQHNESMSDPGADPDADGLINELEFLFGSDPRHGTPTDLPTLEFMKDGDRQLVALTYRTKGDAHDLRPSVQMSDTLDSEGWTDLSGPAETLHHDPATGDRVTRQIVDITEMIRVFLRLSI